MFNFLNKEVIISKIDLAVVLSIFIGTSYALTYLYHAGKLFYYEIPFDFIDVDAKDTFFTMLILSPIIFNLLFNVFMDIKNDFHKNKNQENIDGLHSKNKLSLKETINSIEEVSKDNKVESIMLADLENEIDDIESEINNMMSLPKVKSEEQEQLEELKLKVTNRKKQLKNLRNSQNAHEDMIKTINQNIKKLKSRKLIIISIFIILIISPIFFMFYYFISNQLYFLLAIPSIMIVTMVISILSHKKKYGITFLIILILLLAIPFPLGFGISYMDESFLTFEKDDNTYVVLTIYKDQFLYAPIDKELNFVEKTFNIIRIQEVENFYKESIGKIQMKSPSNL